MNNKDIYQMVTEKVISKLKTGVSPWVKPWKGGKPEEAVNAITQKPYSLLNQILLDFEGQYMTFNQANAKGGRIKKGSKAKTIVFWSPGYKTKDKDDDGNEVIVFHKYDKPILKYYNVFNTDDIEGLKGIQGTSDVLPTITPIHEIEAKIEDYCNRTSLPIERKSSIKAYYSPKKDKIVIPEICQFDDISRYYSTLFHELVHSTGAKCRLNRDQSGWFGGEKYGREELIAEMGAAFALSILGIDTTTSFEASASYIESWTHAIKNDPKAVIVAAGKAEKAVNYILNINKVQ